MRLCQDVQMARRDMTNGPVLALLAAALFGASTPLAKLLVQGVGPWLLAGLLYVGSGLGLAAFRALRAALSPPAAQGATLRGREWLWLGSAILAGGVIGPVLLMFGLARTPGSASSLLLNLEGVFTTLIAWFVLGENFDRRIALGVLLITAGAIVLSWAGELSLLGAIGPLAVAGACLAWAADNSLTRNVSLSDATQIAMLKGCVAGPVNIAIAAIIGAGWPTFGSVIGAGLVGLLGYGVSLVLFVLALRSLGAARTAAYFSAAPFIGAVIAIVALGEPLTLRLFAAGTLMAAGLWLHLTERHEHMHEHAPLEHEHMHRHDAHHRHRHEGTEPPREPHSHRHVHARLRHSHPHYPDAHHRHVH
jgi:drug/metabolite transporter (DMT)-like permease